MKSERRSWKFWEVLGSPASFSLSRCWEGDATKHFSVKKRIFSEKGGGNSVNQGFGKDL